MGKGAATVEDDGTMVAGSRAIVGRGDRARQRRHRSRGARPLPVVVDRHGCDLRGFNTREASTQAEARYKDSSPSDRVEASTEGLAPIDFNVVVFLGACLGVHEGKVIIVGDKNCG
jgi:hypothetical protein